MIRVTENLRKIRDLLAEAAVEAGRAPESVKLLAVSKKQPLASILEAADAGQRDFGESQLQEGLAKMSNIGRDDLVWHFVGHLQSNKTRAVAEHYDWVHSLDNLRTATRLSRQRPDTLPPLNVCIQVNVDAEPSKSGVRADALAEFAAAVAELAHLRLRGLMCLPEPRTDPVAQRRPFVQLRQLADSLATAGIVTDTLSMGMSADFRAAVLEGSTIVRIGTAIFGARQ